MTTPPQISGTLDTVQGGNSMCLEPVEVLMLSGLQQQQVLSILGIQSPYSHLNACTWVTLGLVGPRANLRVLDAAGQTLWLGSANRAYLEPQFGAWLQAKSRAVLEPKTRLQRLRSALFGG
jgi:hypothetical protein